MAATFTINGQVHDAPPIAPGLHVVATPIGNLRDVTIRALETLAACDVLACEDTRITRRLLERYGIAKTPVTYHEHNAESAGAALLERLETGASVALVSDAGTPLISDPGYRLVAQARAAGHSVFPVPGASALTGTLSVAGLPTDDVRFVGFLPAKAKARREKLAMIATGPSTVIAYESPHRLAASLADIATIMGGERIVTVARELTKRFETVTTAPAEKMAARHADTITKGEIVIAIAPAPDAAFTDSETDVDALLARLAETMPAAKAAREAARLTGLARTDLYQRLLEGKTDGSADDG